MASCKHPDRDVPRLVCGYPVPCPHHTVVIDCATVDEVIDRAAVVRWLKRHPMTLVTTTMVVGPDGPRIAIRAIAGFAKPGKKSARTISDEVRYLPMTATVTELRNAHEELTIEARAVLEAKITDMTCAHENTHRGKDSPRRWGSYQTEVCDVCGAFRLLTHPPRDVRSDWKPAVEYAKAVADQELE